MNVRLIRECSGILRKWMEENSDRIIKYKFMKGKSTEEKFRKYHDEFAPSIRTVHKRFQKFWRCHRRIGEAELSGLLVEANTLEFIIEIYDLVMND